MVLDGVDEIEPRQDGLEAFLLNPGFVDTRPVLGPGAPLFRLQQLDHLVLYIVRCPIPGHGQLLARGQANNQYCARIQVPSADLERKGRRSHRCLVLWNVVAIGLVPATACVFIKVVAGVDLLVEARANSGGEGC